MKDMIEKLGITSIFVTHDQDEAIEVADEIIITNRGHIEQKGSPVEVYQSPELLLVRLFLDRRLQSGIIMSSITLKIFRVQNMQLYVLSL